MKEPGAYTVDAISIQFFPFACGAVILILFRWQCHSPY